MKITVIQHVAFEAPGAITKWAQLHNYPLEVIRIFAEQPLPPAAAVDFLVVLGGPMSANDPEEWLVQERALIKAVVADNKPMFGICLGAQQLAKAFHAQIVSTPKEVGWGKIQTTTLGQERLQIAPQYEVLHWHGEGFTLPENGQRLFASQFWKNQGFCLKRALGLQFHLETTKETLQGVVANDAAFVQGSVLNQDATQIALQVPPVKNQQLLFTLLDALVTPK
ncbi:type 1 glutamine amidotransferase [Liquorilactobacillus satsumensis]|uniref:type 1 glutamine amidotransferase n=1 Tax=Liquorilactobacillus satsumensis TaxID=259059 RepID=UPI0021C36C1D|nr:type 1 glutamine amidotransferase [Liquorilactobacillus satsumensis]MCP9328742.1 type 1 glutamine amidotransferase [Liquorilactobacillus satsumensis]